MGKCYKNNTIKQAEPITEKRAESTAKKLVNNLKSSIFCGTKGFLTFNLAFLSYLEYSSHHNTELKKGAAFAMKRNTIPLLEMAIIVPVCFALPAMVGSMSLMQCALLCAALMIATCFIIRTFNLREKLLEKQTGCPKETVNKEFEKDTIIYPIFDKSRKHIEYNSPNQGQLSNEAGSFSFLTVLLFPLNVLQSCIMLSLAAVELFETVPSFCVDTVFDREKFASTKSNLQRSGHLLYASVRNLVPITKFNECVANFIGTPEVTCCE